MTPLDVLPLAVAKDYLAIDYPDYDATITTAIYGMVNLVEQMTGYRLYERQETLTVGITRQDVFQYPINSVVSVLDQTGAVPNYELIKLPLRWTFIFGIPTEYFYAGQYAFIAPPPQPIYTIVLDVGYTDTTQIPAAIIYAIKLLVAEVIENRVPTKESMPNDISMLLNPYMRFTFF